MKATIAFLVLVSGCRGSTHAPQQPADPVVAPATPAEPPQPQPQPQPQPPPPAPQPTATFENVIAAGVMSADDVTALLAPLAPAMAACLTESGPTTTELSLVFPFPSGEQSAVRTAWRDGTAVETPDCLRKLFPRSASLRFRPAKFTNVYVAVRAAPDGATAPPAPTPPDERADYDTFFCKPDQLAKVKANDPNRNEIMMEWLRLHVRHPGPWELGASVGEQDPSQMIDYLKRSIRATGIKKCKFQRW